MSEREAMTLKLVAYHNEQARGASFEWHARCATHVENQEQIIKALADALEDHLDDDGHIAACGNGGEDAEDCSPRCVKTCAALRLAGRL